MKLVPYKLMRNYKMQFAIFIFIFMFGAYHTVKPAISYSENGSFRPFGVGYKHKTVVPAWLVAICMALLSYVFVLFILSSKY